MAKSGVAQLTKAYINTLNCQPRMAAIQFEAAVNPSMGAFLKYPYFKHLKLQHRHSKQNSVDSPPYFKAITASIFKFRSRSNPLKVFEAWMPKQAPKDGFTASLGGLLLLLNLAGTTF